ncbi:hypothetical protein T439DRAFT_309389 [Meredithblackwellia eburnea MCA 4105]
MSFCYDSSGAPIPCGGYTVYNSYVTDPRYQKYFTIAWSATLATAVIATLPQALRFAARNRPSIKQWPAIFGIYEDLSPKKGYSKLINNSEQEQSSTTSRTTHLTPKPVRALAALLTSISLFTLPLPTILDPSHHLSRLSIFKQRRQPSCHPTRSFLPFSLGTLLQVLLIPLFLLLTLLPESQLRTNPNRLGFLALACVPPTFLLSSKTGAASLLLGKGWTVVNLLHRWLGRAIVLLVLLHFYFWTIQYQQSHQVVSFLSGDKEQRGITALAFLLLIALSSAKPFRSFSYPLFFVLHYTGVIGFLVFVNRHTIYARGWATWSVVAIYAVDVVGRLASLRVKYVELEPMQGGMVRVGITGVHGGWRAGQHLSLRLFFSPCGTKAANSIWSAFRMFESHPFSIANAPPSVGVLSNSPSSSQNNAPPPGINLFVRSCGEGTWTGDLYETVRMGDKVAKALEARSSSSSSSDDNSAPQGRRRLLHMLALVEGPYGGVGRYVSLDEENVLLVAGGSGMSFVIGLLDEVVGRRVREGKQGRIEVVWAVRERVHVNWFANQLRTLITTASSKGNNLSVTLRIYLTCDPDLTVHPEQQQESNSSSSSSNISLTSSTSPSPALVLSSLPHTQLIYMRPRLDHLVRETVGAALSPCGNCWPVCLCAERGGDDVCGNDEEKCCGGGGGSPGEVGETKDEIDKLPSLSREMEGEKKKSCCATTSSSDLGSYSEKDEDEDITVIPGPSSCCSPKAIIVHNNPSSSSSTSNPGSTARQVKFEPAACGGGCCANTGARCCSGGVEGEREQRPTGPVRVRNGGLAVAVCGPGHMVAEMRNAVARVPLAKQVRIGGISLHTEHFSV